MKKFEYKTLVIQKAGWLKTKKTFDEDLNQLGKEGWECVNAYTTTLSGSTGEFCYLFKREIEE